jgi:hypothetical protein
METIMNTLTWPGVAVAPVVGGARAPLRLLQRLWQARLRRAEAQILRYLGQQSEARLLKLGLTPEDIAALRQGGLQLPGHRLAPLSS